MAINQQADSLAAYWERRSDLLGK